jgi:hypothetical protein
MASLKVWPLFVRPKEDELLSSWLTRIAHSHQQKIYTFYRPILPENSRIWNIDIDSTLRLDFLKSISAFTATSLQEVINTTLCTYEGNLFLKRNPNGHNKWILPLGIYHSRRKRPGLMYCPNCLRNDNTAPYYRKKWRLSLSFVCPKCKVFLEDRCPKCKEVVCFTRHELGKKNVMPFGSISLCFNCGADLKDTVTTAANDYLVQKQVFIYELIDKGFKGGIIYSHLYFDALYQIISILISRRPKAEPLQIYVCRQLNINIEINKEFESETFEFKNMGLRIQILQMAFYLLGEWPQNFISSCLKTRTFSSILFKDAKSKEAIPFFYFNIVDQFLSHRSTLFKNRFLIK